MARKLKVYNAESAKTALDRFIVSQEANGEWRAFCPVCEDPDTSNSPSASFNFDKNVWNCQSTCADNKGSYWVIAYLIPMLKDLKGFDYRAELQRNKAKNRNATGNPLEHLNKVRSEVKAGGPTEDHVKLCMERLIQNKAGVLDSLIERRGFTAESIRGFEIGFDGHRYTLPVRDAAGVLVNIRRYKPDASQSKDKMMNIAGHGEGRLYNLRVLKDNDTVVLVEGEPDCILLNQYGIPAITHTSGAATFKEPWAEQFAGKTVYICYDNDETGKNGAAKAAKYILRHAKAVFNIEIPIPTKGADVTDYLYHEGNDDTAFKSLMANATPLSLMQNLIAEDAPERGKLVGLEESMNVDLKDDILEMTVSVAGKQNPPFKVPKQFMVTCSQNKGPICQDCPVFYRNGEMSVEIGSNDTNLFKFVGVPEEKHPKTMKQISGALCMDRSRFDVTDNYYMEELIVGNSVDNR